MNQIFLKEDEPQVLDLIDSILNEPLFLEEDISAERKIIVQEYHTNVKNYNFQLWKSVGECLDQDFSIIGSLENINEKIKKENLIEIYNKIITEERATLCLHNASNDVKELSFKKNKSDIKFSRVIPKGDFETENTEISTSAIFLVFEEERTFNSIILAKYLNHIGAPFNKVIREKEGLTYGIIVSSSFG